MSKKIAWITDSGSQVTPEFIKEHNIHVLPLSVVMDGETYREDVDITQAGFYEKLKTLTSPPKTSQPAIGEIMELLDKVQAEGYDAAIAVMVSTGMSGTFYTMQSAAKNMDIPIYVIDSKIGSYPMTQMIEKGMAWIEDGIEIEEVIDRIEVMTKENELFFIPLDLQQLHRSGRVSGTQLFLSMLLNIKVVAGFDDGAPIIVEKVRAYNRAKNRIMDFFREDMLKGIVPEVAVVHCNDLVTATSWREELLEEFPKLSVKISALSLAVGVHAGEGTTGLSWVRYR